MLGVIGINDALVRIPFARLSMKAIRPDLNWLRQTIDKDYASHHASSRAEQACVGTSKEG